MTKLEALKASILHWERIAARDPEHNPWSEECALCARYERDHCNGCPVSDRTGRLGCCGSPYNGAYEEWNEDCFADDTGDNTCRKAMRDFLRELLADLEAD